MKHNNANWRIQTRNLCFAEFFCLVMLFQSIVRLTTDRPNYPGGFPVRYPIHSVPKTQALQEVGIGAGSNPAGRLALKRDIAIRSNAELRWNVPIRLRPEYPGRVGPKSKYALLPGRTSPAITARYGIAIVFLVSCAAANHFQSR